MSSYISRSPTTSRPTATTPIRGARCLSLLVLLGLCAASATAVTPKDYAVLARATVTENPPAIALGWPSHAAATGYVVSRKLRSASAWNVAATLPATSTGWTDTGVAVGTLYEYKMSRTSTTGVTAYGYLCAGIRVTPVDRRGTVVLLVDSSMATPLASQLKRLIDDLVGDGWSVLRHDVARTASVTSVKALIKADYAAAPSEVRAVFLFGHIPVPYSGDKVFAGGHAPEHLGAHPADLYYGEMDGAWTDTTVRHSGTDQWQNIWPNLGNVPGDGRFDQSRIPSGAVELEVGRVDLANMPAFLPKTETDLLRQYLDKDHLHRHAQRVLPRRGLIEDHFGEFMGWAFATGGWRAWSALFGAAAISEGDFTALATQGYLGFFMCGPGWNTSCQSVGRAVTTKDFALTDPKAAFTILLGSHFGDWNIPDNFLRAPLATTTYGLASVYNVPHWFMHPMGMGSTIGEVTRMTQNNQTLYSHAVTAPWETTNSTFIALMGDPTLRLFAVAPPKGLAIAKNGAGNPVLTWTASPGASLGYHIYRSSKSAGPFTRLSASPVTSTNWTDGAVASGTYTYQVKAVTLETTPGGTYFNTSQAVSGTIALDASQPPGTGSGSGSGSGFTAAYFANRTLTGTPALVRTDARIDFTWGLGSPGGALPVDGFSARWTGQVRPTTSGTHTFHVTSDDGVRVWVNGVLIIDRWIDQGTTTWSGSTTLTAGQDAAVRMEYYEHAGGAMAKLEWSSATMARTVVPSTLVSSTTGNLDVTPPPGSGTVAGFTAAYFANRTLTGTPALVRTDARIDFTWGLGSPGGALPVDGFSVRWTGQVRPTTSGTHTFHVTSDDGVRVWVNGVLIIDRWIDQGTTTWSGSATLTAGQDAAVTMEYYEHAGGAMAKLEWSSATMARTVVPSTTVNTGGGALPAGWTPGDIGAVAAAGKTSQANGTWTIAGSGADIWDAADECHFTSRALAGDGEITARIVSQGNTHGWAKAGVMLRESRSAGARQVMAAVTPANGATVVRRNETNGASFSTLGAAAAAPCWLRLSRVGNEFTAYQSTDGANWRLIGRATILMGANVQIGLAVSSHADGTLGSAVFDQVVVIAAPAASG